MVRISEEWLDHYIVLKPGEDVVVRLNDANTHLEIELCENLTKNKFYYVAHLLPKFGLEPLENLECFIIEVLNENHYPFFRVLLQRGF